MPTVSLTPTDRARKTVQVVLQALAGGRAASISMACGITESTISRLKNEHLTHFATVLAHAGLKVVPAELRCFDPEYVRSLHTLAQAELKRQTEAPTLDWDDTSQTA